MVGSFIAIIIGYFFFLIITYNKMPKPKKENEFYRKDNKEYSIKNHKLVRVDKLIKDRKGDIITTYRELKTNKRVVKGIDRNGLQRWYYIENHLPMQYFEDKRISTSLEKNVIKANDNNKLWCVAENFWDDTIIRLTNYTQLHNTYLDDYTYTRNPFEAIAWNKYAREWNKNNPKKITKKIIELDSSIFNYGTATSEEMKIYEEYFYNNNPLNQKVYLRNMRPYQLCLIGTNHSKWETDRIRQKQYLIRFGKEKYFNYKTQHCISDKQISALWSKWYAITEEEYLKLTMTRDELPETFIGDEFSNLIDLKSIKQPKLTDIAFEEGNEKIEWNIENCGIKKAFDEEGNFIGEQL